MNAANATAHVTDTGTMSDDELDRAFDEVGPYEAVPDSAPASSPRPVAAPASTQASREGAYPDLSNVTAVKVPHKNMILDGVCTHCAHCGQQLTDSVSVQRGIGPVCSKKGYVEDPVDGDEIQAMIDLGEFPELVKFLVQHYKPLGVQGLVNGLVRVASLNRPRGRDQSLGNRDLFIAICDSVYSLGHRKMSEVLRNTLVVATIVDCDDGGDRAGCVAVHVKFRDLPYGWGRSVRDSIWGASFDKEEKSWIVPVHRPGDANDKAMSRVVDGGVRLTNKKALWKLLVENFPGMSAKTKSGVVKIK